MANPAFRNEAFQDRTAAQPTVSVAELEAQYQAPSALRESDDPMTVQDTIVKSVGAFGVLLIGAAIGWFLAPMPMVALGAAAVGFVLGLVNCFKRVPSPALILLYAAAEGVFLGAISAWLEAAYQGIVTQAVVGTLIVVGVTLALFASGRVRASARATKVFLIAMIGYGLFSVLNLILMLTGAVDDPWGLRGATLWGIPIGLGLGVLAVLLCAYSLVLDFDFIQRGVKNGAPRIYGWSGAFGIMVTVVWLYTEILRILALLRR